MELDHDVCYRALASRDRRFDGRFFIAVRTTNIYCRPICPARTARSENVVFYPSAAAAQEAGFRPCLRCRPEAAPDSGAWRGVSNTGHSNTVSRALALIESGALDEAGIDALVQRLGVGERQLRRLFTQHVGASPVAVAQTRRVLLAKQLLHETTMPVTDIAFASGFGSVRRFNEVFQAMYHRPPSALRRAAQATAALAPTGHVTLLLRFRPPFDWAAMLRWLEARAIGGLEVVTADGAYARTIGLSDESGTLAVRPGDGHALAVTVRFPVLAALPAIIGRVRQMFDLAADPEAIANQLATDALLGSWVAERPGLRVPGAWDGFEETVRAALDGHGDASALVSRWGRPLPKADAAFPSLTHVFPQPSALEQVADPVIAALARSWIADPEALAPGVAPEQGLAWLRAQPGLGETAVQHVAAHWLRDPDAFAAGDPALREAAARQSSALHDPLALQQRAEAWRPWRAYAAQWLLAAPQTAVRPAAATRTARSARA